MKRFDLWKLSLLNVFASPVRSLLTVLGFAIGVAAILAVLTLGEAGRNQVENEMARLGIDRIWLTGDENSDLIHGTGEWLMEATGVLADELAYVPVNIPTKDGNDVYATIIGCEQSYLQNSGLTEGRMLWPEEWKGRTRAVLSGENLAGKLGIAAGDTIPVLQDMYIVAGIIPGSESVTSVPLEDALIMPLDELCRMIGGVIHEIQLRAPQNVSLQNAQKLVLQAMELNNISVSATTMQVQMEAASSVIFTFVNVLKWVALVCILVGGIGVMNILLVGVRERKREIGIMKSMGATSSQICSLFLLEALIYAVNGGFLGILIGLGLIDAAGRSIELSAKAGFLECIIVFGCAAAIGVFFGVLPALRAAQMKCVDALRQD